MCKKNIRHVREQIRNVPKKEKVLGSGFEARIFFNVLKVQEEFVKCEQHERRRICSAKGSKLFFRDSNVSSKVNIRQFDAVLECTNSKIEFHENLQNSKIRKSLISVSDNLLI